MNTGLILSIVAVVCIIILPMIAKRSASKACTKASDRRLIEMRLQAIHICRSAIVIEVLIVLAMLFAGLTRSSAKFPDRLFVTYGLALFSVIGMRNVFSHMKIAVEAELEDRRLHAEKA